MSTELLPIVVRGSIAMFIGLWLLCFAAAATKAGEFEPDEVVQARLKKINELSSAGTKEAATAAGTEIQLLP